MRRRQVLLAVLPMAAAVVQGCATPPPPAVRRLAIATGAPGDIYQALGTALAQAARARWAVPAEVLSTGGSVENLEMVAAGRADVGFTTVDTAALALHGEAPFRSALPVSALAGLYDDYLHLVVRRDSAIVSLGQVRGRRMSIGLPGSAVEVVAERMLNTLDLRPGVTFVRHTLSAEEAADALAAGRIDAFAHIGGLPTPLVDELARRLPIRLLSVGAEVSRLQDRFGTYYLARSVPVGVYGLDQEVQTVGVRTVLVVHRDLPYRAARAVTGLLFAARPELSAAHGEAKRLDSRSALVTFPVPLHPGAARYYRDTKPMALGTGTGTGTGTGPASRSGSGG